MSLYVEQKKNKPAIENVIPDYLSGDKKKLALEFVEYLQEKKMKPGWASVDSWKTTYKNKGVCYMLG